MEILDTSTVCLIKGFDQTGEPLITGAEISLVKVGEKAYAKVGEYFLREKVLEALKRRIQIAERIEKPDVASPSLKLNVQVDFKFFMSEQFSGIVTETFEYGVEYKLIDNSGKIGEGIHYMTYAELKARLAQAILAKYSTQPSIILDDGTVNLNLSVKLFEEMRHLANNLFD